MTLKPTGGWGAHRVTGEFHHTLTSQAAGVGARALGASDQTADRVATGVDLAQGAADGGASIAAGMVRKGAVEVWRLPRTRLAMQQW